MLRQELHQLQQTLNRKADRVQAEFNAVGDKLQELARQIKAAPAAEQAGLLAAQAALRDTHQALAEQVNQWRDRARDAMRQSGSETLDNFLNELIATNDEAARAGVERVRDFLNAPDQELPPLAHRPAQAQPTTPAGRLIERARAEFDLRVEDPAPRRRTAFEFANRAGVAQNDEVAAELEKAREDPDHWVQEVATLSLIQMYRFRAKHLSELEAVHAAVERLLAFRHPAVIPVLVEVLENPRTGFDSGAAGMVAGNNRRSRLAALAGLAEWHTAEAQAAVRARLRDRDPEISRAAADLLEQHPGEWR